MKSGDAMDKCRRTLPMYYSKCQKFFPNYPENPLFEKSRFSGPFLQKLLSYAEITLMVFRTLPVAPGCNKVPEKEKTSGNHYTSGCKTSLCSIGKVRRASRSAQISGGSRTAPYKFQQPCYLLLRFCNQH
jgi:hypothetical protein